MPRSINTLKLPSRYRVEKWLGGGGFGDVYLATDLENGSLVAIKTLKNLLGSFSSNKATNISRFYNEFGTLKHCQHPNIIHVFDFCEHNGDLFFTMEYLEGSSLGSLIPKKPKNKLEEIHNEHSPIDVLKSIDIREEQVAEERNTNYPPLEQSIEYLFQIAQGLNAIHSRGLLHRDLKPENVFITKDNTVKLIDFGFAKLENTDLKLTVANNALGTPYYMAPESIGDVPLDHRADIYSFGILAFELLTKELPYDAETQFRLSFKHALAEIPSAKAINPEIPDWLDGLITTCMQKDKTRRYQSALEIIAVIAKNCPQLQVDNDIKDKIAEMNSAKALRRHEELVKSQKREATKESIKRILIVFCLTMFFTFLWLTPIGTYSNILLLRTLFAIRGPIEPPKDVVIVAVDDLTYQHFGISTRQPFPRKYWAQALEKIHATKPKVVIIDGHIQAENDDEENNKALERAIASGPTVLMNWEEENRSLSKEERDETNTVKYHNDRRFSNVALLEIVPFFLSQFNTVAKISLAEQPGAEANERVPLRSALERAHFEKLPAPSTNDYINFYGPPNQIKSYSMYEVISGYNDFGDKIVLMGVKSLVRSELTDFYDLFSTSGSFLEKYFGVEIHATITANLIDISYLRGLSYQSEVLFICMFTGALLMFLVTLKPLKAFLYFDGIVGIWLTVTAVAFIYYQVLIPGVVFIFLCSVFVFAVVWGMYGNRKDATVAHIEKVTGQDLQKW